MTERKHYRHPPLAMVVLQVGLAYEPGIGAMQKQEQFVAPLRKDFGILRNEPVPVEQSRVADESLTQIRATNDSATATISLNPWMLEIAVTGRGYQGFETSIVPLAQSAVSALLSVAPEGHVERIILRYLNEIRMPHEDSGPEEWSKWINPSIVEVSKAGLEGTPREFRTVAHAHKSENPCRSTTIQCGTHHGRSVIASNLPIAPRKVTRRQAIVVDIESEWYPESPQRLELDLALSELVVLHNLVTQPFEWAITDFAREKFQRSGNAK